MSSTTDITYFSASELGEGELCDIISLQNLILKDDIYLPSIRDFHVIFWIRGADAVQYIDFTPYTIPTDSIILLSKDHLHYFDKLPKGAQVQSIVFTPEFLYRRQSDLDHLFSFDASKQHDGIKSIPITPESTARLDIISEQMFEIRKNGKRETKNEALYHLLSLFLIECKSCGHLKDEKVDLRDTDTLTILNFNKLLEEHYKTETKVDFYVGKLGVPIKSLAKIIKSRYNASTKSIIDKRRILEMKRMLKGTDMPVKEIAYDTGFDEPTNMVKFFKKHTSFTPQGFRTS